MIMPGDAPKGYSFYGGPFSNFASSPIRLPHPFPLEDDEQCIYPSVEHRFQAMKANDREEHDRIAVRGTPGAAKRAGRALKIDAAAWDARAYDVMVEALRAKFQDVWFREWLLATESEYIYEDSPTDAVWGLWNEKEKAWTGKNQLGKALMQVREEIQNTERFRLEGTTCRSHPKESRGAGEAMTDQAPPKPDECCDDLCDKRGSGYCRCGSRHYGYTLAELGAYGEEARQEAIKDRIDILGMGVPWIP